MDEQVKSNTPDFNKLEQEVLKAWDDGRIFEKSLEQTKDGDKYIFYDGPPFATGVPHIGHILASAIKDAVPRYQTMKGNYVRRRWGWDCHGLPIENIVEKNLNISGKKQIEEVGVERFNKVCRENVLKFVDEWGRMVHRMGRWVDFENSYKTMDTSYQESVWWALQRLWEKKLIYEDRKVLLYCSRCETPISNFEVAMDNSYRDITEESVYAKFKILPRQRILNDLTNDKTFALAWTTTPWTLPGNTALNVGPDIAYVMVEQENGERYILAKDRLGVLEGSYETIMEFPARSLEGLEYEPLYPGVIPDGHTPAPAGYPPLAGGDFSRAHRIYLADFVTTTDGTGVVHNAAMYGEEDYQLARQKDLPRVDMLDHKGRYLPIAPENLQGQFFKDGDGIILKELREKNLVYKTEQYLHSYPHCHRCGTPLFYNALPAWFINIQSVKSRLIGHNEEIQWHPAHLKHGRFAKSMESAPDWNISRNRYWATALPFWKCEQADCRNVTCVGSVGELAARALNFSEVYPDFPISKYQQPDNDKDFKVRIAKEELEKLDLHKPFIDRIKIRCDRCGKEMSRVPEVVDCWVESASMPFAELHYPFENDGELSPEDFKNRFPADFVAEYIGQTRAWFYVMHVMSTLLWDGAPFRHVVTTGNILAEDGSKMSKSKGNFPDSWGIVEKYGVDALRFYLLTSPVMNADDVSFSEKGVQEINRKLSLILFNVWSFYRMYEKGTLSPASPGAPQALHILDTWIMDRLSQTGASVTRLMDGYDTVRAGREITEFINDLSTWYVRRSRERMKGQDEQSRQALNTLGLVLAETCKLLAPFMPFLSDYIFRDVTGKESVHLEQWTEFSAPAPEVLDGMQKLRGMVEFGLSMRKDAGLKVRQPLSELEYHIKNGPLLPAELEAVLAEELNVKTVSGRSDFSPKNGWIARDTAECKMALNTVLTPELKAEGLARELERQVQDLRKKSGLSVGELVDVYYNTQSEELEDALLRLVDRKKTFVSQVTKSLEVEVDFETQADLGGNAIWIGLTKV